MKVLISALFQTFFASTGESFSGFGSTFEHPTQLRGFWGGDEIPYARLAHFPAQIGHWRISSREVSGTGNE